MVLDFPKEPVYHLKLRNYSLLLLVTKMIIASLVKFPLWGFRDLDRRRKKTGLKMFLLKNQGVRAQTSTKAASVYEDYMIHDVQTQVIMIERTPHLACIISVITLLTITHVRLVKI